MSRQQQLIYHVKDDQRRHSIVGKTFPCFGEGEIEKALRVTHEGRVAGARQSSFASGHRIVVASHLRSLWKVKSKNGANGIRDIEGSEPDWLSCEGSSERVRATSEFQGRIKKTKGHDRIFAFRCRCLNSAHDKTLVFDCGPDTDYDHSRLRAGR